jgi:hypothetical protein
MDIYDLAKYYRDNQGYKYILCFADVYSRKEWDYKIKIKIMIMCLIHSNNLLKIQI